MKRPLRIVLCKDSPYNLFNALGPFAVILQPSNYHRAKFSDTSIVGKTLCSINYGKDSDKNRENNSISKSVKYSRCHEFLKWEHFSGSPGRSYSKWMVRETRIL